MRITEPIKWKKHLVLQRFGLRTMEELERDIHRYKKSELMIEEIRKDMYTNKWENSLYTISLVDSRQLHKLPNINVRNLQELDEAREKIKEKDVDEFWYCKKVQGKDKNFSVGRISFDLRTQFSCTEGLYTSQTIEQVWNAGHRKLEGIHTDSTYLRASRINWGRRYSIEEINISDTETMSKQQLVEQFIQIVKEIERQHEHIIDLSEYLIKLGINQFSLEYVLEKDKFQFIDWDSQDDLKIINGIVGQENER